jgi:PAS domain S-box-containing protein
MITNIQQFEALFNHATIGIVMTDKEGKIININKYAEMQFGYSNEELISNNIDILVPTKIRAAHHHLREGFYRHPEPRRMGEGRDLFAQKKDGTEFPVEISLSNYEINEQIFVIAFVIDITVRKKNEAVVTTQKRELENITAQIRKLNIELEQKVEYRTKMLRETLTELEKSKNELSESLEKEKELNELKSRFVTTASHEFRTPLSTILSSAFLLEKYNDLSEPGKRERHIQKIKIAVEDMKAMLEDFLSLGKLEEGLIKKNFEELAPDQLFYEIKKILSEMESLCKKGQHIAFAHSGASLVYIDKMLFKNILINLMSNAIKFSPENAIIEIACEIADEYLEVSVKDHGIGISDEDQQHLFGRFFRAKNAVNIQGTGLGLHIISKYLELMKGYIHLKSKLNEGSVFTFVIPQKKSENKL